MVSVNAELAELIASDQLDFDGWLQRLPIGFEAKGQELLRRAWNTAREVYGERLRPSGVSYFAHALGTASILTELKLDVDTIAAAFLHEVLALGRFEPERYLREFGPGVTSLIQGHQRMEAIQDLRERPGTSNESHQAETLRKMLLAMARDVRVVFIALAERLDDMRSLKGLPEPEQRRIAEETKDLYAPLANRLGIWQIKWELEDLCLRYLDPVAYKRIAKLLAEKRVDRERYIERVRQELLEALKAAGIEAEVSGRPKHLYSIWKKMQRKNLDFDQLFDLRAVRILVKDVAACYAALGVVHSRWRYIPKEFDDYIATPKENNYRSLHTAVVGPEGKVVEVQIRTYEMHQTSELGIAAHWRYKEGGSQDASFEQKIAWLRQLLEWGKEETQAEDFIDRFKAEVFEDRVYVVSPKGDIVDLPRGATPLDYAYYVHSSVGHRCRGAKVDGHIVPLTYTLRSGQQVEILTNREGAPSRDWLNPSLGYLTTSRARAKVKTWFRQQDHDKNVAAGRTILDKELHRFGIHELNLEKLAAKTRFPKLEDFLAAIGRNDVTSAQIAGLLTEHVLPKPAETVETVLPTAAPRDLPEHQDAITIYGVGNLLTRMAGCCKPAPGDEITGFITRGQGVTIHRRDCVNIRRLPAAEAERLIEVSWGRRGEQRYPVDIHVEAYDRQGLLRDISAVLSNEKINVLAVNTRTDPKDHHARMSLTLEVSDLAQMSRVMDRIGKLRNVLEVVRRG